jgi:hypothetical protein
LFTAHICQKDERDQREIFTAVNFLIPPQS